MSDTHEILDDMGASVRARASQGPTAAMVGAAMLVAAASCVCGPGLSPTDEGVGGASSSTATTDAPTEGTEPVYGELWRLSTDGSWRTQPPVGDELENVYSIVARHVPDEPEELHTLVKVSEQGQVVWELDLGHSTGSSGVAVGPNGDVWICFGGAVSRVSSSGSLLWTEDDACTGERSLAVGPGGSVSVHARSEGGSDTGGAWEVVAIDGDGTRSWARDVGVLAPYEENQTYVSTAIFGAAIDGTSVYVGCDTCAARPALAELDRADGSIRSIGELDGVDWAEPHRTIFGLPRVTADGVWIEAYEDENPSRRRTWRWSMGSAAVPVGASLPIEADTGLVQKDYGVEDVQLLVDGEIRVVDFGSVPAEERASLRNAEPAARGSDDAVLMVSASEPLPGYPRHVNCGEESCRAYVVDASGRVTWVLGEESRLPHVGADRIVYVASNGDLVAHGAPLSPRAFGWAQWLANGQGNGCRGCAE